LSLPLTKAHLNAKIRKEATSLLVAMKAETKTRTPQLTQPAHTATTAIWAAGLQR
jgi:hypothetical protein